MSEQERDQEQERDRNREQERDRERLRAAVEARVLADWGFELPDSLFRFHDFIGSLDPVEASAFADLELWPYGVMDLFDAPGARARDGVDIRAHGRYYRDPPEFLTFLHGGTDGLHYGLWYDDGRTCAGVGSYYNNDDGGGIDRTCRTPLEAVRVTLERHWYDLHEDTGREPEEVAERAPGMARLRSKIGEFETGDRTATGADYVRAHTYGYRRPPVEPGRITTIDGGGALAAGETALGRPPYNGADEHAFGTHMAAVFADPGGLAAAVAEARRRLAAGDPTEALVLGRDLHWASVGDATREGHAHELLAAAYRALDRPALAAVADAHHRHRDLPRVDVLEPKS
ncbi:ADP-ribosylation family protein [Streptomyces sp. NPDC088910]|uniref:ADP-ribosylation family protein n=1 Tax=Streptomyces sp. NPDC088910 TaxID=3365911 RepID=UPI00382551B1